VDFTIGGGYSIEELGTVSTLPCCTDSNAWAIDSAGDVAGDLDDQAFLWVGGVMTDIGTLGVVSDAVGINTSYQIVGTWQPNGNDHAFLWQGGVWTDLGTFGGTTASAYGINESGDVVGSATLKTGEGHAFLWRRGVMTDLGTLPGATNSEALAINASGHVVGDSGTAGGVNHAFLWKDGVMTDLGGRAGAYSIAEAINSLDQVVGTSNGHAVLWANGVMQNLGMFQGLPTVARGINTAGVIVGQNDDPNTDDAAVAFVYTNGVMVPLNDLITPSDWSIATAAAINDAGQIVGYGLRSSDSHLHAYRLDPK
jgi:probable HAF family extracellular repeat protein